jgi:predicted nucleic acid-binding protein
MRVFFDTNIYIHLLDASVDSLKTEQCRLLVEHFQQRRFLLFYNALILTELSFHLRKRSGLLPKRVNQFIREIFLESDCKEIQCFNSESASHLVVQFSMLYPDAFIAQALMDSGIALCSYDKDFRRVKGLELYTPAELLKVLG